MNRVASSTNLKERKINQNLNEQGSPELIFSYVRRIIEIGKH